MCVLTLVAFELSSNAKYLLLVKWSSSTIYTSQRNCSLTHVSCTYRFIFDNLPFVLRPIILTIALLYTLVSQENKHGFGRMENTSSTSIQTKSFDSALNKRFSHNSSPKSRQITQWVKIPLQLTKLPVLDHRFLSN